jgi:hypothetical protein
MQNPLTQTAVPIVYHHVAAESHSSVVVNAARAIRDITHDDSQSIRKSIEGNSSAAIRRRKEAFTCAPLDDVCDCAREHLETLGHLECDHFRPVLADVMNRLVDLERIVGR